MVVPTARFPKPRFEDVLKHYSTDPESVHVCSILNPTTGDDGINTCAARLSEALVLANDLVKTRIDISGKRVKGGVYPLLGSYGFKTFGNLCGHGIARGARDLGEFLGREWGAPREYQGLTDAPAELAGKTGVLCFVKLPTFDGQGHVDLWNGAAAVGNAYWDAKKVWFWQLK